MKILRLGTLVALTLASVAPSAHALPHKLKFLAGSGVTGWGVQVGTYKGQLDGNAVDIWCVDFMNHISVGSNFNVNLTSLGGSSSLSNTRFGFYQNALDRYQQAAWLAWQFSNPSYHSDWKYIHAAIWHLMTPTNPVITKAADVALVNTWLTNAQNNYRKYDFSSVFVVTDVAVARCRAAAPGNGPWNRCGYQEQLTFTAPPTTVTPEPASMALLATGLVALTLFGGRRRRKP